MSDVTQYREHRSTHPTLIGSAEKQVLAWYELLKKDGNIKNQFRSYFGGSTDSFDAMVNGILTDADVLALGDQECSALHPVMWDTGAEDVVPPPVGFRSELWKPEKPKHKGPGFDIHRHPHWIGFIPSILTQGKGNTELVEGRRPRRPVPRSMSPIQQNQPD